MNVKKLGAVLGKILLLEGALLLAPLAVSLIYREPLRNTLAYLLTAAAVAALGLLLQLPRPERQQLYQKEGFALTALAWIVMTLFGAIPLVISGDVPRYVDACFEIMSGFTTTGASVIEDITAVSHSGLFWRSFTHWIGGMGILVFVLIFIPESKDGSAMYLLRAESPGPQVGKIVSKMKVTARILYLIYLGMTVLEAVILLLDEPIPGYESEHLFFSLLASFGCAGTGGFGFLPGSIELFHPFSQYVMAIFLLLFGCNFSLYYLLLLGKLRDVLRSEELRTYLGLAAAAVGCVFFGLVARADAFPQSYSTEEAFRHALFQVSSLMTTAGFSTTDYNLWPQLSVMALVIVMFTGAMAGSTAGGIKLSRIVMAAKGGYVDLRKLINPRAVPAAHFEGKPLESRIIHDVFSFITMYFFILLLTVLLLAFDPVNGTTVAMVSDAGSYTVQHGFFSNFSAALSCLSNVGPGFEAVGPYGSFALYSDFSTVLLTLVMLLGRLEILPVLILFSRRTWSRI